MNQPYPISIRQQQLWLSAERAIFWEQEQALLLSDLHLGKSGHFRKSGIPMPQELVKNDLHRLVTLIQFFKPRKLLIVGDLFHSHYNLEWDWFHKWVKDLGTLDWKLIRGNHDILEDKHYEEAGIDVIHGSYEMGPFQFTHEAEEPITDRYLFSGHIHPGVLLKGLGKQSLRFPCFHFGKDMAVLPAFGAFTGSVALEASKTDKVIAIVEKSLIPVQ